MTNLEQSVLPFFVALPMWKRLLWLGAGFLMPVLGFESLFPVLDWTRNQTSESVIVPVIIAFGLWIVIVPVLAGLFIGQGGITLIVTKEGLKIHRFYGLIRYSRPFKSISKFTLVEKQNRVTQIEIYFSAPLVAELNMPQSAVDYIRFRSGYSHLEKLAVVLKALEQTSS
jgi:hypothetical protein